MLDVTSIMVQIKQKYIYFAWFLIGILGMSLWFNFENLPAHFSDISFHMANAQGFLRAGGPVTWNFWESVPLGRANNYPPIFHIILASLISIGIDYEIVVRLAIVGVICGGLLIYFYGLKKFFSDKIAFLSIVPLIFSLRFVALSSMILPASLIVFLSPWFFYFFQKKKWRAFTALLIFMLYTHMIIPQLLVVGLIIYILIFDRKKDLIINFIKILLLSYALYLPWLITILIRGRQFVKYLDPQYQFITSPDLVLYIDVLVILFSLFGIYIFWKWNKITILQNYSLKFFLILMGVFLAIGYSFPSRAVNGHGFVIMALFSSVAIVWCEQKIKYISLVYTFLLVIGSMFLGIHFYKQPPSFIVEKNSIATMSMQQYSTFNQESEAINRVATLIKMNSSEHESVATLTYQFMSRGVNPYQQIHVANYLASRANRPVVNMRQPEIYYRNQDNLANAKIIITQEPFVQLDSVISNIPVSQKSELIKQLNANYYLLEKIPINLYTYFYVYKNIQERGVEEQVEHAKVNLYLADLMIVILIGVMVWDTKKSGQKG